MRYNLAYMGLSNKRAARITISVVLFLLFIFANFYTIRMMARYGVEVYLYDKLLVACQLDGTRGIENELARILSEDKYPHELAVAKGLKNDMAEIKDPEKYLRDRSADRRDRINLLRNMRLWAFGLILLMILLRFAFKAG